MLIFKTELPGFTPKGRFKENLAALFQKDSKLKNVMSLPRRATPARHEEKRIEPASLGFMERVDPYALLALLLTCFAWASLLSPNYFMGAHDAHHSLFFPIEFHKGILDGFWLPRWAPDFAYGYGYPMFVFYAPLSFYIWESFHVTDLFGVVASTKATFVVGFLLGAAGTYAYARDLWGRHVALLAALVYTYLPYHFLNIYVRAALAEFLAMGLLPWIALAFRRLVRRPSLLTAAGAAGSYGALLWTHNITALLFTPLLGALILFELFLLARERSGITHSLKALLPRVGAIGASIALGVAIGTAVWLPSVTEQNAINISQWAMQTYRYADHFVYPSQLLSPFWGFGYSLPGSQDGMSFQLGTAAVVLAGLGVWELAGTNSSSNREWVLFHLVALLALVGLMLPPAVVLWDAAPLATLVQFPWRLLALLALPLALLAGRAALFLSHGVGSGIAPGLAVAILLVLASSVKDAEPQMTPPNPRDETQQTWRDYERAYPDMVAMVSQTGVQPTTSPMLAALEANETPQRFEALTPGVTITQLHVGGGSARARIVASTPASIRYLTYWYPGWSASLDGEPLEIRQDGGPLGLMQVEVPAGAHLLAFRFGDPPLRRAANLVSLGSLLILGALVAVGSRQGGMAL
ncbi:MAG: 6-pyruvoyl-tetrahydropterin synthase-related protein [Ardenticatenaceae bacterium]